MCYSLPGTRTIDRQPRGDAASIEWIVRTPRWLPARWRMGIAILRLHPNGDGYGGEYDVVTVATFRGRCVMLRGLLSRRSFNFADRRLIAELLRSEGATRVEFERKRGTPRMKTVTR